MTLYVIDGSNVCNAQNPQGTPPDLRGLLNIITYIIEKGDTFYCVFDANFPHLIKNQDDKKCFNNLIKLDKYFVIVTGGTRADDSILDYTNRHLAQALIISNDRYNNERKKYANTYTWLRDEHKYLIKFNRLAGGEVLSITDPRFFLSVQMKKTTQQYTDDFLKKMAEKNLISPNQTKNEASREQKSQGESKPNTQQKIDGQIRSKTNTQTTSSKDQSPNIQINGNVHFTMNVQINGHSSNPTPTNIVDPISEELANFDENQPTMSNAQRRIAEMRELMRKNSSL